MKVRPLTKPRPGCWWWSGWLSLVLVLGSSPVGFASPTAELLSIRMLPAEMVLRGVDASRRFVVLASFADGLERDVTSQSRIRVSDPALARLDGAGRLRGLADGPTDLSVEFRGYTARMKIQVKDSGEARPFRFARDIGGILTRRGCNNSSSHGSVVGRGGFKLSMNALNPRQDYNWIMQGGVYSVLSAEPAAPSPPRVNLQQPEQSLFLLKATATQPHGGGLMFRPDSAEHQALLDWIRNGATYPEEDSGERLDRLEVLPEEVVLDSTGTHQLLVLAHFADARQEDVSDQVRYVVSDGSVAEVTESGLLRAKKGGETLVTIHGAGRSAHGLRVVVVADPILDYPPVERSNFIDEHVFTRLRRLSIIPSRLSSDAEFLRRVCLDLTGTLPPPDRAREFLASNDAQQRNRLIETLLESPEYVEYWTFRFAELFRVGMLVQNSTKNGQSYWEWVRESVTLNKHYDQMARERIAAQGEAGPVMHFQPVDEFREPEDVMAEEVRVFLGRRLDCAQCHDHPYEAWSQDQFWGMTAFFSRLTRLGDNLDFVMIDYPGGHGQLGKGFTMTHPRTGQEVEPRFLDGRLLPETEHSDPRMRLAEWMTSAQNPYFAEAAVNRIWSYFFGRGIVNPVDDFRASNAPTQPALLRALAGDFKEHAYDLKHLLRVIVQSRTYQLSQKPNETNRDDKVNNSRSLPRPLDAEVLWDAINQFVGVEEDLERWRGGRASTRTRTINLVSPELFPAESLEEGPISVIHFLQAYGQPTRLTVPERTGEPNLRQALHILTGSTYTSKLAKRGGRIDRLLAESASSRQVIEELYLAALSRYPTDREHREVEAWIAQRPSSREPLEDLAWSLISSREFPYNH